MSARRGAEPGSASLLSGVLATFVVAQFVLTFVAQGDRIPSASMVPTLRVGDFTMVNRLAYAGGSLPAWCRRLLPPGGVQRGDLIVFHHPRDPARLLVKRVVAIGGDRVRLIDGRVLIDGVPQPETYAFLAPGPADIFRDDFPDLHSTAPELDPAWWRELLTSVHDGEITVPAGSVFALGDNRNASEDSRYWGFVPQAAIVGEPVVVYFRAPRDSDDDTTGPLTRLRQGLRAAHVLH